MNGDLKLFFPLLLLLISAAPVLKKVFPGKQGCDRYGGYLARKGTATGRFHLEKIDGRHFLITPEGHGFLAQGVTHTRGLARPADSRYDFLKQSLGGDWDKANAGLLKNFRQRGYNSLGYDSHETTRKLLPHFAGSHPSGKVNSWMGKTVEFPDVFGEPWKKEAPGRQRYQQFLKEKGAEATDEVFLVLIAREIYSHIGPITRKLFPDTLIFGERYAGVALPWQVIAEALSIYRPL